MSEDLLQRILISAYLLLHVCVLLGFLAGYFIVEEVRQFERHIQDWSAPLSETGWSIRAFIMEASDWCEWPRTRFAHQIVSTVHFFACDSCKGFWFWSRYCLEKVSLNLWRHGLIR